MLVQVLDEIELLGGGKVAVVTNEPSVIDLLAVSCFFLSYFCSFFIFFCRWSFRRSRVELYACTLGLGVSERILGG